MSDVTVVHTVREYATMGNGLPSLSTCDTFANLRDAQDYIRVYVERYYDQPAAIDDVTLITGTDFVAGDSVPDNFAISRYSREVEISVCGVPTKIRWEILSQRVLSGLNRETI